MPEDTHPLDRFTNIETVIPELVVATPAHDRGQDTKCLHRLDVDTDPEDPLPACHCLDSAEWHLARSDDLIEKGFRPCGTCWRQVLEMAAVDPESPVGLLDKTVNLPDDPYGHQDGRRRRATVADGAGEVFSPPPRERAALTALTDPVLISSHRAEVFHAPIDEGEALCGAEKQIGDNRQLRRKSRAVLRGTRRPCGACFDMDVIDWSEYEE